ncbi:hypothetical protein KKH03_03450, partial [Patescibacteria group bacterium]|nr:hypothetical protein [Patescibacteria group bacterium]
VTDSIFGDVLRCEDCGKGYKIIAQELAFYRGADLPLPHVCADCRHKARLALRNPRKLCKRACDKCSAEILTTYAVGRPEKIYCGRCYAEEME